LTFSDSSLLFSINGQDFISGGFIDSLTSGTDTLWVLDGNGCLFSFEFEIGQPEPISILATTVVEIQLGSSVQISAIVQPAGGTYSFAWSPAGGLSCWDCPDPFVQGIDSTVYTLTVTDEVGCEAQAFITVIVDKDIIRVYIPNIFSPNGDGKNDLFTVFGGPEVKGIRSLKIFDRWGEKIFERSQFAANQLSMGWDGTFRGKKMNPGVFAYLAEIEIVDGQILTYEGTLSLIR